MQSKRWHVKSKNSLFTIISQKKSFLFVSSILLSCSLFSAESNFNPPRPCTFDGLAGDMPWEVCGLCEHLKKVLNGDKDQPYPNAWIFSGAPGTGKTKATKEIAQITHIKSDLHTACEISEKISATNNPAGVITKIFEEAQKKKSTNKPIILIIDDLQLLLANNLEMNETILSSLRTLIDKYEHDHLFQVIFTTNHAHQLEEGLANRCSKIEFPIPNKKNRKKILQHYLENYPRNLSNHALKFLVFCTKGFSGSDIEKLVRKSTILAKNQKNLPLLRGYCKTINQNSRLKKSSIYNSIIFTLSTSALILFLLKHYPWIKKQINNERNLQ